MSILSLCTEDRAISCSCSIWIRMQLTALTDGNHRDGAALLGP